MTFLQKLFGKKKTKEELEWEELVLESNTPSVPKPLSKEILSALSGKQNPLETKALLDTLIGEGWDSLKPYLPKMAMGKIPTAVWVLEVLFGAYPQECGDLLLPHAQELPLKNRLALFAAAGEKHETAVTIGVLRDLPAMEPEDLGSALRILTLYPSAEGKAAMAALLKHEDWRIVMKAASALGEVRAVEYLPQLKALSEKEGILGDGVKKILRGMEQ